MVKKILIGLGVLVASVLLYAALLAPKNFRVSRELKMEAPAAAVFPHINNLKKFNVWNPWAGLDPNAKYTFAGPEEGVGASNEWEGNGDVGSGKMTVVESQPASMVKLRMDWKKPTEGMSMVTFTLKPEGNGTMVTWAMSGDNGFIGRLMCMFMSMDKLVGDQFIKGLTAMKALAEADTTKAATAQ